MEPSPDASEVKSPQSVAMSKDDDATTDSEKVSGLASYSGSLKGCLLLIFCFAQFLDAFNNSSFFAAIPPIAVDLGISNGNSVWLISAYQLTFAALLLVSGILSDLFNPKYVFCGGMLLLSFCALGAGFVRALIPLTILRAFMGIGAALNIPSAMALIIKMFPEPIPQGKAVVAFAGAAAIGNVIGLIIGALLSSFASWPWILYFASILSFVLAAIAFVLLPATIPTSTRHQASNLRRLDSVGVFTLTAALVLFVFAVTSGSVDGWNHAKVIAPLIISVVLVILFFVWESKQPEGLAAVPPSMWQYENFTILTVVGLQPFMWWASVQLLFSWYYQIVFGWTTISVAVRFLPLGLVSFPIMGVASALQQKLPLKWVILLGEVLVLVGTVLFPFADSQAKYWRFAFPGFFIGTAGMTIVFATANVAIFKVTPPEAAGIVGAIFTCALQLGSAAGAAVITSIQTSVESTKGGPLEFKGRSAGFWFLFAFNAFVCGCVVLFMKNTVPPVPQAGSEPDPESGTEHK